MFSSVLAQIRRTAAAARVETEDRDNRLRLLQGRLRRAQDPRQRETLSAEIQAIEERPQGPEPRIRTVQDHLAFVADALSHPAQYLDAGGCRLRLSRLGIKLEPDSKEPAYEVDLSEIRVASQEPRIGAMVRFPREELLPKPDHLRQAEIFLAL